MKKTLFLIFVMLFALSMQARKKGKPLHLGRCDYHVGQPIQHRMPARIPFSLYLDQKELCVNSSQDCTFLLSFVDADGNVLSEVVMSGLENEVQVPDGTSAVLVYSGISIYIAYL